MMEIRGTHGTCVSRAEQIAAQGMTKGPGRVGVGAYFWTAIGDSDSSLAYAMKLAENWATRASRGGQYTGERDPRPAIVHAALTLEEGDYVSLDDPQLLHWLRDFLGRRLVQMLGVASVEDLDSDRLNRKEDMIHGIIEAFIEQLEDNIGTPFKVVFKAVPARGLSDPLLTYIGNPNCFAIRDTNVIRNIEINHL